MTLPSLHSHLGLATYCDAQAPAVSRQQASSRTSTRWAPGAISLRASPTNTSRRSAFSSRSLLHFASYQLSQVRLLRVRRADPLLRLSNSMTSCQSQLARARQGPWHSGSSLQLSTPTDQSHRQCGASNLKVVVDARHCQACSLKPRTGMLDSDLETGDWMLSPMNQMAMIGLR